MAAEQSSNVITMPGNTNISSAVTIGSGTTISASNLNSNNNSITLPTTSTINTTTNKTKTGSSGNLEGTINKIAQDTNTLVGSYGNLVSKVQQMTGITLPNVTDSAAVSKVITGLNTASGVISTFANNQNGSRVQADSTNPQAGAFKWVEEETTPMDFISYDSVLLFVGEPLYADNAKGAVFTPLGMCVQFNISTTSQVTTLQELCCEEQIVLPGKSQPISISISRMCGKWSNLLNRLHGNKTDLSWNMSMQYKGMRDLFGLYCIIMDTSRRNIIHSFYVERCAIESINFGISAGQMQVIENCAIRAGRIIDPNYAPTTTSTTNITSVNTNSDTNTETGVDTDTGSETGTNIETENKDGTSLSDVDTNKIEAEQEANPWAWEIAYNGDYASYSDSGVAATQDAATSAANSAKAKASDSIRTTLTAALNIRKSQLTTAKENLETTEKQLKSAETNLKTAQENKQNAKMISNYQARITYYKNKIATLKKNISTNYPNAISKIQNEINSNNYNISVKVSKR